MFVGLLPGWYPPNYDCGACGYATCAEFLHHTKTLRSQSAELEFTGPVCNLRDVDLGIAVGSAAMTAAIHSIDCRCQTRAAVAARKLGLIQTEHAVALSLSMTHKAVGFDRPMPEADFDNLDLPPTGVPGATRRDDARNRQAPRHPIPRKQPWRKANRSRLAPRFAHVPGTATRILPPSAAYSRAGPG